MSTSRSFHWGLLLIVCLALGALPTGSAAGEDTPQPERYIVQLDGEPLAAFAAQIASLESQPVQAQRARLSARRQGVIAAIARRIGAEPAVSYVYDAAFNGIAIELTPGQARVVADLAGVVAVQPEQVYALDTDAGPAWIGASQIWDGSVTKSYMGEGVVIGMIDSGINTTHPAFAEVGGDGYRHQNPLGQGVFRGACDPSNLPSAASGNPSGYKPAITCNNKLIGAWTFAETAAIGNFDTGEPSPNDDNGHGSHTASTAAGNVLTNVSADGVTYPRISGVAPHANIIAYDVCGYQDAWGYNPDCPEATLLAAINQAIIDQVDVINYSISGGTSPWDDPIEQAFLNARAAGIVVSSSAGNSGPTAGTVAHQSPWLLSVAATSHNRRFSYTTRVLDSAYADIMASFSSRGPASGLNADLLKPDLAAPGVSIFAAYANSGGASADYDLLSGTSMAAPHVAGAAALLAGLHPDWTPGQIQSALMTTSLSALKKEDQISPTTPFDSGAGRVRLERAALAGLTLDQTVDDFRAANPALGGEPRDLNLPSMADAHCVGACTWTRTVRSTMGVSVTWTATTATSSLSVTPNVFTIAAGGTQVLTFTMDVSAKPFGSYLFDRATLSATGGLAPDVGLPVAALPQASDLPAARTFTATTHIAADTIEVETVAYSSLSAEVHGMTRGTARSLSLIGGVSDSSTKLSVPANTSRVVAEIRASTSQDVDLYLISDSNSNGVADSADTVPCQSASAAVEEYCSIDSPAAGTYFVSVKNYTASQPGASDQIDLLTAVVPKTDAGNLSVAAPASSGAGTISVQLNVNAPTSAMGDYWYAQVRLTDTASARLLGVTNFNFRHLTNAATALTVSDGGGQHTVVNTAFPKPLAVRLTNSTGGRIANASVTFSAPTSGASATFVGGSTATTNSNGVAQVMARANGTIGSYQITASAAGAGGQLTATFTLENTGPLVHTHLPLVRR